MQVRLLSQVGGSDPSDTARRVMKKLMTGTVALQFNWMGRGQKRAFSKMNLWPLVCGKGTVFCFCLVFDKAGERFVFTLIYIFMKLVQPKTL